MAEKVHFELVTPDQRLLETEADMVVVPGGEGDFGVLPGHAPLLSTLRPGTVDVYDDNRITQRLFVGGGFADVTDRGCTVLADEAMEVSEITSEAAEARIKEAEEELNAAESETAQAEAERRLKVAEALRTALRAGERAH